MRALLVLACALPLLLAGCFEGPNSGGEPVDPEFPFIVLGLLVLAGVVLLAINLGGYHARTPPAQPLPPPSKPPGWVEVPTFQPVPEEPGAKPAKPRRRA